MRHAKVTTEQLVDDFRLRAIQAYYALQHWLEVLECVAPDERGYWDVDDTVDPPVVRIKSRHEDNDE